MATGGSETRNSAAAGATVGMLAALMMLAVMYLLRLATTIPTLPELMIENVTLWLPLWLFSDLLRIFEDRAKPLLLITLIIGHLVMGTLLGLLYARLWGRAAARGDKVLTPANPWAGGLVLSILLWMVALALVMPASGARLAGLASRFGTLPILAVTLLEALTYGLCLAFFFQAAVKAAGTATPEGAPADQARRQIVLKLATAPVALLAAGSVWQYLGRPVASPEEMAGGTSAPPGGNLPDEITPNRLFYAVSKDLSNPVIRASDWSLTVRAQNGQRLTLNYNDLKSLPAVEEVATLTCISNDVGGGLISNARWTGVRLRDLLAQVGAREARKVVVKAWEGYSDSIPFDRAIQDGTILAYLMNGETLPPAHGFPARLIVPGIYGMKNVKWVEAIELVDYNYQGYWQESGWSDAAIINTMSRLDMPRGGVTLPFGSVELGGIAFAGDRGISKVEISHNSGKTWTEVKVKEALSPYAWSLWTGRWQPDEPGNYVIYVRATDRHGNLQDATERSSLPNGATGYDILSLTIKDLI